VRGRELILRREHSAFAGAEEYIFKHALLRDVTYETVLLKHRAEFHGKVAHWLEEHAGDRLEEHQELIAEHYIQAGQGVRAAALLERAAGRALRAGLYRTARQTAERALELRAAAGQMDGPALLSALETLSEACTRLADLAKAVTYSRQARDLARAAGDVRAEALSLAHLVMAYRLLGKLEPVPELVAQMLRLGQVAGGRAGMRVLVVAAFAALDDDDTLAAEAHARDAMALAEQLGHLGDQLDVALLLAMVTRARGESEQARSYGQLMLDMARQADHLYGQAEALVSLGYDGYLRGDYVSAREQYGEAIGRFRELGMEVYVHYNEGNLAQAELRLGDTAAARQDLRNLLSVSHREGRLPDMLFGVFISGQILVVEGQAERALRLFGLTRSRSRLDFQLAPELEKELAALNLPAEQIETGLAAGAALDIETTVQEILDGKW
jgi:tetratricopeptide (TPR) repeat protein